MIVKMRAALATIQLMRAVLFRLFASASGTPTLCFEAFLTPDT